MKRTLTMLFLVSLAAPAAAQEVASSPRIVTLPVRQARAAGASLDADRARGEALSYHGGPVIVQAKVVFIFWGPTFANPASPDHAYAQTLQAFRGLFGTSDEYSILTQYYQVVGGVEQFIEKSNLAAGTADEFDTSPPPTAVTDADVQSEVDLYLKTHAVDYSTLYAVVIPSTSYSEDGGEDSCGGPNLAYCAYHSWVGSGSTAVKYAIAPYPSCSGCQWPNWTAAQNQEAFVGSQTVDTVTDPIGTGWWDTGIGEEISGMCGGLGSRYLLGTYAYQYLWSNKTSSCVQF